jgi:hypothetical protein
LPRITGKAILENSGHQDIASPAKTTGISLTLPDVKLIASVYAFESLRTYCDNLDYPIADKLGFTIVSYLFD